MSQTISQETGNNQFKGNMQRSLVEKPDSLSIRIRPGGFSLYIYGENGHIISQRSLSTDLLNASNASILDRQPEVIRPYKKTALVCETDFFTLIPDVFTDPGSYRSILQMHHSGVDENLGIFYEKLPRSVLIYALPRLFIQNVQARLPDAGFYSHLLIWLKKAADLPGDQFYVYIREKKIDCIIYSKKNLQFYNSFDYETREDIVYHCIHLIDQFQLDTATLRLQLIGDEERIRPDQLLGAYIPQVLFTTHNQEYENYQW